LGIGLVKDATLQATANDTASTDDVNQFNKALDQAANTKDAGSAQNSHNTQNSSPASSSPPASSGTVAKPRGNLGDVNMHRHQGLRGKGTPGALESEHLEPVAVQRENMRNPATGRSPVPAGRGSAFDKNQPTVMLNKSTADAKTALDRPVIAGAKNAGKTGQVPTAIANEYGPEAGLARARAAAQATGTTMPVGAEAAAIGQTDAKYADRAIRAFPREPVNNPLLQTTDEEVCRAVETPLNANTQTAGHLTSLAATKDSAAETIFKGTYSEVPPSVKPTGEWPHSSVKPSGGVPPLPLVSGGGGVGRVLVSGLTIAGDALAVKGTIDDAEEGDYVGAGLNVTSIASGPVGIVSGAYHVQKAEAMAYGAILDSGVDSAKMYALYIDNKISPKQVIESHVDLSNWSAADREEVRRRYLDGE
jgi:hypothetical protein